MVKSIRHKQNKTSTFLLHWEVRNEGYDEVFYCPWIDDTDHPNRDVKTGDEHRNNVKTIECCEANTKKDEKRADTSYIAEIFSGWLFGGFFSFQILKYP